MMIVGAEMEQIAAAPKGKKRDSGLGSDAEARLEEALTFRPERLVQLNAGDCLVVFELPARVRHGVRQALEKGVQLCFNPFGKDASAPYRSMSTGEPLPRFKGLEAVPTYWVDDPELKRRVRELAAAHQGTPPAAERDLPAVDAPSEPAGRRKKRTARSRAREDALAEQLRHEREKNAGLEQAVAFLQAENALLKKQTERMREQIKVLLEGQSRN